MSTKDPKITAIIHASIIRPNREAFKGSILIKGGKILEILPDQFPVLSKVIRKINARGMYVAPGFIDLHVHGAGGYHFLDKPYRNLNQIVKTLYRYGTTSLLPTLSAAAFRDIIEYIRFIKGYLKRSRIKSSILGLNLEGPFLSIGKRGAQPLRALRLPNNKIVKEFMTEAEGLIKVMTLAPELQNGLSLIKLLKENNIIPAIGHTRADYEITRHALDEGLSYATHFFNSYPPLHHRAPGALAALLEDDMVTLEMISDGVHVSPVLIRLLFKLTSFDKIVLVTDGTAALGKKIKSFSMGGRKVSVKEGMACLSDGTLVGSILSINQALVKLIEFTGFPIHRAISLATLHPARVLGVSERKGDIKEGMDADLVIFDKDLNIKKTIVAGSTVYPVPGRKQK